MRAQKWDLLKLKFHQSVFNDDIHQVIRLRMAAAILYSFFSFFFPHGAGTLCPGRLKGVLNLCEMHPAFWEMLQNVLSCPNFLGIFHLGGQTNPTSIKLLDSSKWQYDPGPEQIVKITCIMLQGVR